MIANRCIRCMHEMNEEDTFCTNCGYDQRQGNSGRALPVGTLLGGKYLTGAVLGEGGFGITYAAWDTLIGTRTAIKEYFPSGLVTRDTTLSGEHAAKNLTLIQENAGEGHYREGLARFVEEAGNLAKFQKQPGVVSVKDFFYENNTAYMVMEYIEGVTLSTYLGNHGESLTVQETFQMMEPVMKTLEAIHREGVIHRDISPDNIMVTAEGQLKLIDFGAARYVGADDEKSLTVMLKHGYAPEEQYRSDGKQGSWTDVYALSAVIYRMLTGTAPEETVQRMTGKGNTVHKALLAVPGLSGQARRAIEKGLALKAEKRYRTIGDLYDGIYGKKRDIRKWAAGAGLAAVVVLCVIIVGVRNSEVEESSMETAGMQEAAEADDNDFAFVEEPEELAEAEEPEQMEEGRFWRSTVQV